VCVCVCVCACVDATVAHAHACVYVDVRVCVRETKSVDVSKVSHTSALWFIRAHVK
jgi:hypothetical protein